jgi:hypothetical protein
MPPDDLVRAEDGTLYGMNPYWLYKWQPNGSGFTILKRLPVAGSEVPFSGHLALSGSTLFGARSTSGRFGGDLMTVFRIRTDGSGYSVLKDDIPIPPSVVPPGIVLSGDTLYGWGFKINTDGAGYTELSGFPFRDPDTGPESSLDILVSNNHIFGTTAGDGHATLFRLNTDGTGFAVIAHMGDTALPTLAGTHVPLRLVPSGDSLFFSAPYGGEGGAGAIYRMDLAPALSIARTTRGEVAVFWPSAWSDVVLQENRNALNPLNWSNVTDPLQDDGANRMLIVNPTDNSRFYRLVRP